MESITHGDQHLKNYFSKKSINCPFNMLLIPVGKSMNFKCKSVQDEEKNSIRHLEETQPLIQESEEI